MAEPLKVRGQCPVCQKSVTKDAPRGRVTWRGSCTATKSCSGTVIARRFRSDDEPSNGDGDNGNTDNQPPAPPKNRRRTPRKVPRVGYAKDTTKDTDDEDAVDGNGDRESDGKPADVQDPSGGTSDAGNAGGESTPEPPRKRRREYPYGHLFNW